MEYEDQVHEPKYNCLLFGEAFYMPFLYKKKKKRLFQLSYIILMFVNFQMLMIPSTPLVLVYQQSAPGILMVIVHIESSKFLFQEIGIHYVHVPDLFVRFLDYHLIIPSGF